MRNLEKEAQLIEEFLGGKPSKNAFPYKSYAHSELWHGLILNRIEEKGFDTEISTLEFGMIKHCHISEKGIIRSQSSGTYKPSVVYDTIINFLQWYYSERTSDSKD